MTAETIEQTEAAPDAYPAIEGLAGAALATAWSRVEYHIAWRFAPRLVVWQVLGDDSEWSAPLRDVVSLTASRWDGSGFAAVTLAPSPGGWWLPEGHYRIAAVVGAGPVPAPVATAVKRLGDYLAAVPETRPGERMRATDLGELSIRVEADPGAVARAMVESGAADLLRGYRRA